MKTRPLLFLLAILMVLADPAYAQSPAEMSYQGYLEDAGTPVDDGNATLTFRLFDAATGGSPRWNETHNSVDIEGGIFNVTLGTVNPLNSLEFYRPLWVEIEVERGDGSSITLAPRTPLGASPYTMGLVLPILQDASVGGTALTINNTGSGDGIKGEAQTALGRGIVGRASAFTGANRGVYGISMSEAGTGVYGEANTSVASAPNYGVFGTTNSASGFGVHGEHVEGNYGRLGSASNAVFGVGINGNAARFATIGENSSAVLSLSGVSSSNSLIEGYRGRSREFEVEVDGTIRLYRNGSPVLTLDPDFGGDSRVMTQELQITGGSDLAEHFDITAPALDGGIPEAGMVVAIDPENPGRLVISDAAYDPLVAGVISGAGGIEAGLTLGQHGTIADGEVPVSLVGRVYVWADAAYGAIRPGDLLTTAPTPGHAMRVTERERAYGAVLGKAMTGLQAGTGLVLVLVNLQ